MTNKKGGDKNGDTRFQKRSGNKEETGDQAAGAATVPKFAGTNSGGETPGFFSAPATTADPTASAPRASRYM